jgi:hypothetical protein
MTWRVFQSLREVPARIFLLAHGIDDINLLSHRELTFLDCDPMKEEMRIRAFFLPEYMAFGNRQRTVLCRTER